MSILGINFTTNYSFIAVILDFLKISDDTLFVLINGEGVSRDNYMRHSQTLADTVILVNKQNSTNISTNTFCCLLTRYLKLEKDQQYD